MANKGKDNKNIMKELEQLKLKLKPIEIKTREVKPLIKEIKEEKKKVEERKQEPEQEPQRISQFSERILSEGSPRKFANPVLGLGEQKGGRLEETASMAPSPRGSAEENKTAYAPSSISYSGSGAYEKKESDNPPYNKSRSSSET